MQRVTAVEEGLMIRAILTDVHGSLESLQNWEQKTRSFMRHLWLTNCKSLGDQLRSNSLGKVDDKRLSIDLTGLRQLLWFDENNEELDELKEELPDEIRWIDTSIMLVDALTKDMNSNDLRRIMKDSKWSIEATAEFQITKMAKEKYRKQKAEEKQRLKDAAQAEEHLRAGLLEE